MRRDDVTSASATVPAASPSANGPGGHSRAARASTRVSWTCVRTRSSAYPPIDASPHGTTKPAGGAPSTARPTSAGEQRASSATMALTAAASASTAEPSTRCRAMPASRTSARSSGIACVARKHERRAHPAAARACGQSGERVVALPLARADPVGHDAHGAPDQRDRARRCPRAWCESRSTAPACLMSSALPAATLPAASKSTMRLARSRRARAHGRARRRRRCSLRRRRCQTSRSMTAWTVIAMERR